MGIEIVVPTVRQEGPERLVKSLALGTRRPDLVTIVSNETQPFETYGLNVRFLRFSSDRVAFGDKDVALRQNIGIYWAQEPYVLIQSDDQIATPRMVERAGQLLAEEPYFWANHRRVDFTAYSPDEIRLLSPTEGLSRENPAPGWHTYRSCFSGMLGFRREFMRWFGGFDMIFNQRHAGEDQQLGLRLLRYSGGEKVYIHHPPFAWLDLESRKEAWLPTKTNVCTEHTLRPIRSDLARDRDHWQLPRSLGMNYLVCDACPTVRPVHDEETLFSGELFIRFDPTWITVTEQRGQEPQPERLRDRIARLWER